MKIPGQTSLDQLEQVPAELRARLRSLWVESVEEYVALLGAAEAPLLAGTLGQDPAALAGLRSQALALVAPGRAEESLAPKPGGALGCRVRPELLDLFSAQGRLGARREAPPAALGGKRLPPAVRLMKSLSPPKDQGERGTCVAFAGVALREFLAGPDTDFSEQFLYWGCKELDGQDGPGTTIHTAMSALSRYGVCREESWPYSPKQDPQNESQGPPPRGAVEEARRFRMAHSRTVEPSLVEHYKQVLAGDDEAPGMPVVIGVLVFRSWYMSAETHRTGKITLPLPGERPLPGGHAMCVVGYVDEADAPGGGYFIVRNSWGAGWAADNPEAPGHALMPYGYVEQCAVEAFTGPAERVSAKAPENEADLAAGGYVRVLEREGRDLEQKLLRAGTAVLCAPEAREEFFEDNPGNRAKFLALDCAWTEPARQRVWFPAIASLSPALVAQLDRIRSARVSFFAAIQENVLASLGTPFPEVHAPRWIHLLPYEWEPKIKGARQIADLTGRFFEAARKQSGARADLAWPAEWEGLVEALNPVLVYQVEGFGSRAHVVVALATRFRLRRQAEPQIVPVDQAYVDAVQTVYREWRAEKREHADFAFFTVGTAGPLADNLAGLAAADHWVTLSCQLDSKEWEMRLPPASGYRPCLRDFLDRLKPESRNERIDRIETCVKEVFVEGGNATVERVKRASGYRRSNVREAFFELQKRSADVYRVWTKDGQLAIRKAPQGEPIRITAAGPGPQLLRRHGLRVASVGLGAAVGVLGSLYQQWLGVSGLAGLSLAVPILYVGSCLQAAINRRADKERE